MRMQRTPRLCGKDSLSISMAAADVDRQAAWRKANAKKIEAQLTEIHLRHQAKKTEGGRKWN